MSFKRDIYLSILFCAPSFLDDNTIDKINMKQYIVSEEIDSAIVSAVVYLQSYIGDIHKHIYR